MKWALKTYLHDLAVWWRWRPRFLWRLSSKPVMWTGHMGVSNHTRKVYLRDDETLEEWYDSASRRGTLPSVKKADLLCRATGAGKDATKES